MRSLTISALGGLLVATPVAALTLRNAHLDARYRASAVGCTPGRGYNVVTGCSDCQAGTFGVGAYSPCLPCPLGSASSQRASSCTCQPGYYNLVGGTVTTVACLICPPGFYSGSGATFCSTCPTGYTSGFGAASCTPQCKAGTYLSLGRCPSCPAGTYSNDGATSCTSCSAGTYSSSSGASSCQTCGSGTTSSTGATSCISQCPAGKYLSNGVCAVCPAGSYSGAGASSCSQCPANTYSTGNSASCQSCPSGSYTSAGSSQCFTSCKAGQYLSNGTCMTCLAGFFSQAGASSCSDCPTGTYSSAGAGSCTQCPSNTAYGSTIPGQCIAKCSGGQIYSGGRCQQCPAGTYSNNNMCSDCPAGSISNVGSTTCSPCLSGSVPSVNQNSCQQCPRNTYSNGGNCNPCPAGSTSNPGSSSCGPQPSKRAQHAVGYIPSCTGIGMKRCDVLTGMGGSECINVLTTLDSCGGCVGPEGEDDVTGQYTGRDCTAIAHVNQVKCQEGVCMIGSCRAGYEPLGESCVEKAAYVGRNGTSHALKPNRGLFSH